MAEKKSIFSKKTLPFILIIGAAFLAFYFNKTSSTDQENLVEVESFVVRGIDLSHHNSIPDPYKLKEEAVSFVYMKATEGVDHLDQNYQLNHNLLKEVDIKVGAYHFYTFGISGLQQAQHFIKTVKCESGDLIPAIDVEHSPINPYSRDTAYVGKIIRELKILEAELHRYFGKRPLIYTNMECYRLYIKKHFSENLLWIADLNEPPTSELKNWRIWQFSHQGKVRGVDGKVDLNFYRYTMKDFEEMLLP